jgi:hypothetical protein
MVQINYSDECQIGDLTYAVYADSDETGLVRLRLSGVDEKGVLAAEGTLTVPTAALVDASTVLRQALTGLGQLKPVKPRIRGRLNPNGPAKSYHPWSNEEDERLRSRWMTEPESASAVTLTGELALAHGRSRNSIRAHLAKLHLDPDVPGRQLGSDTEAAPEDE